MDKLPIPGGCFCSHQCGAVCVRGREWRSQSVVLPPWRLTFLFVGKHHGADGAELNPKNEAVNFFGVCVCESNSVPKRSKPLSWQYSWCSCRGTQEAHRAVSNEALYGVFRISGLITLTYLHLWNCWQAVLIPCFPALGTRTTFPLTIPITLDQFSSRSIQFSFSIVFKNWSEPSLLNFGSVPQFTLDRV